MIARQGVPSRIELYALNNERKQFTPAQSQGNQPASPESRTNAPSASLKRLNPEFFSSRMFEAEKKPNDQRAGESRWKKRSLVVRFLKT